MLTLQNEVARDIARHVAVTIPPRGKSNASRNRARYGPEVAEAYLKGRSLCNTRSKRALEQAADAFQTAIGMDGGHAQSVLRVGAQMNGCNRRASGSRGPTDALPEGAEGGLRTRCCWIRVWRSQPPRSAA